MTGRYRRCGLGVLSSPAEAPPPSYWPRLRHLSSLAGQPVHFRLRDAHWLVTRHSALRDSVCGLQRHRNDGMAFSRHHTPCMHACRSRAMICPNLAADVLARFTMVVFSSVLAHKYVRHRLQKPYWATVVLERKCANDHNLQVFTASCAEGHCSLSMARLALSIWNPACSWW